MKESISKILLTAGYGIFLITFFIFIINLGMIIKSNSYEYVVRELDTIFVGFVIMLLFFSFSYLIKLKHSR